MPLFIIDNNLPRDIRLWQGKEFLHIFDLNPDLSDSQIWEFAQKQNAVIISKDSDFSKRILHTNPPPKVIHIKLGNYRTSQLVAFLEPNWGKVMTLIEHYKMVEIYYDRMEGIK